MWLMRRPGEQDETTWEEYSEFHKDLKLNFTVSEIDCEPKVEVFCKQQKVHGSGGSATSFLSQYHIQTHQGNLELLTRKSNSRKTKKKNRAENSIPNYQNLSCIWVLCQVEIIINHQINGIN